jgi:hypothetical protein
LVLFLPKVFFFAFPSSILESVKEASQFGKMQLLEAMIRQTLNG